MTIEQVVITAPAAEAPEGHEAAMIAKVDAASPPTAEAERPSWLPEKFKSAEDMAKAYAELEAKQGSGKPAVAAAPAVAAPAAQSDEQAAVAATKAGLDMSALKAEFSAAGKLSDESIAKLEAAGFDKATVDAYVAGQEALASQFQSEVMAVTPGGADKYTEMVEWAKANLSDAEIAAYNTAVGSGNKDQAKLAVSGLGAKFSAAVGSEPNLIGGIVHGGSVDVFESVAQVTAAMRDPLYGTDPAYRAKVQAKLGRSQVF